MSVFLAGLPAVEGFTPPAAGQGLRRCDWCRVELEATVRRDAVTCSKRCRQARGRFNVAASGSRRGGPSGNDASRVDSASVARILGNVASGSRRLAYADPPYPGNSGYYRDHVDYAGEVDHRALVSRLEEFDGWALSTSAESLPFVLSLLPGDVRVAAWVRGERPVVSGRPLSSWEPVVYRSARDVSRLPRERVLDSLVHCSRPRLADPFRVIGAKPAVFCAWMFDLLGARAGDDFEDLFPGSGGVARAWSVWEASRVDADVSPLEGRRV